MCGACAERVPRRLFASKYPPPPLFAPDAVARLYAALGACFCAVSDETAVGGFSLFHPLLNKEVLRERLGVFVREV